MRLIFCHIPKTAGTSVRANLAEELMQDGIRCINAYRAAGVPPDEFPRYELPDDWRFLSGHIPMKYLMENPKVDVSATDILFLTFIRDPIDRLISWYNYVALNPKHPQHEKMRETDGIEYVRAMEGNVQVAFLRSREGVIPDWKFLISSVDDLERASAEVMRLMVQREVPGEVFARRRNVTKDRFADFPDFKPLRKDEFPEDLLRGLYHKHAEDMALYKAVKEGGIRHTYAGLLE